MTLLKQAMAILGTVLTIAVLVAIISPKTAHAIAATLVQIEPGTTTQVGQNESQLVSLFCQAGNTYCIAISPEGTYSTTAYVVPAGYTLIVTDWEYFSFSQETTPGDSRYDELQLVVGALFIAQSSAVADAGGMTHAHEKYETGIRVASGETIYDNMAAGGIGMAFIQGYLVPN